MSPSFDFTTIFAQGLTSFEVMLAIVGMISAAAFAVLLATRFGNWVLPSPRESRVSDFLPFASLMEDGITIKCANGTYARVFRIEGMDLASATPEKVYSMMEARKSTIDSLSELSVVCRVITLRERTQKEADVGNFNNEILERVSKVWSDSMDRIYTNTHYMIVSVADRKDALKDLNYACQTIIATLGEYGVFQMYENPESPAKDSPFFVFSRLCSPVSKPEPKVRAAQGAELNEMLSADHIHFTREKGIIHFFSGDKDLYEIVMGIRTTGDYMDESMIVSLLSIDCELVLLHNVRPIFRPQARLMLLQQQRMAAMTNFSGGVVEQYGAALAAIEDSDADYQALTEYALTIIIKGADQKELNFGESEVQRICRTFSVTPVREGWITQASFFSQFPTYDTYPRTYRYLSRIVALAISFDKPAEGFSRSDWGPGAITTFRTMSGSAYQLQFRGMRI